MPPHKPSNGIDTRQRRAHEKSRHGCMRCKRLRKKCDEAHPSCSRCAKQKSSCQYSSTLDDAEGVARHISGLGTPAVARHHDSDIRDSAESHLISASPLAFWRTHQRADDGAQRLPLLNSCELELLSHYITHTSRVIPSDNEDMFALHVGMPNLAFTSGAVMGSVLALSAACKCHDILSSSAAPLERLGEIHQLLALADRHHQASLDQLQQDISERHFASVLANGALMVLYALSGHSVRVLLARKAKRAGISLTSDMLPFQSQWITSIRAAHVAYVGLLSPGSSRSPTASTARESGAYQPSPSDLPEPEETLSLSEDGPSEETRRLLLPIISATYEAALAKLRLRTESLLVGTDSQMAHDTKYAACLTSLRLLERLFLAVLGNGQADMKSPTPHDLGTLENAPPWLVKYLARVTSASPSKLWRRTTMAFLNRVPIDFLQLVQSALDFMPVEENQATPRHAEGALPFEAAHKPAMDIFAHWLVLVMLLDGVWWIGDVGHWELGRVVRFMKSEGFEVESAGGDTRWPETMHALKLTLAATV